MQLSKDDRVIFMDSETYFHPGILSTEQKYHTPTLRLLTYKYWDGEKFSRTYQIDTQEDNGDPWTQIRQLMGQGYIILGHNAGMYDLQPALTNHKTEKQDWILPFLVKGQVWDTMCVDKLISGMNPEKNIDPYAMDTDIIETLEQEESALEETEVDGTKLRGFSLKVLVWKYCRIKLDKKYQEFKYYISTKERERHEYLQRRVNELQEEEEGFNFEKAELNAEPVCDYLTETDTKLVETETKLKEISKQKKMVESLLKEYERSASSPDIFYSNFSNLVIDTIKIIPDDKLTDFRLSVFSAYDSYVFNNDHLKGRKSFEQLGTDYLFCYDYHKFIESLISYIDKNIDWISASGNISLKERANILLQQFQDSMVQLNKFGKGGIDKEAIKYSLDDIKYLPDIYCAQKAQIAKLQERKIEIHKAIELTHKLLATTYLGQRYGVHVNAKDVKAYTKEYMEEIGKLSKELLDLFPKVSKTEAELITLYSDAVWVRKQEIGGIKTKADFKKALKSGNHTVCMGYKIWKEKCKDKDILTKVPKLSSHGNVKEALNKLGILVLDTKYETLKEYAIRNEVPCIDTLLKYKEKDALLTKTLTKFTYNCYLRPDDTVPTTYHFTGPANWRSSSKNPNVQNLSRDLKSLFGTPPGMYNISYDLSGIELVKLVDQYKPKLALESFKFPDQHIFFAAMYYDLDPDKLYERYKNEDPEAELMRQSSKTLTYMNIYKSPCDPKSNYVTGVKKIQQIYKSELGIDLPDDKGRKLILNCERVFDTWTKEKLIIEEKIRNRYNEYTKEKDPRRKEAYRKIGYQGPLGHLARFYLEDVYMRDQKYVNARSIYSVLIAGFIAVGVKSSVVDINEFFYNNFGFDNARLTLTVHDSNTAYVAPEVFPEAKQGYIDRFLKSVYVNSEFKTLPVEIEGYCTTHDFKQIMLDGSIVETELNDKGKRKYKKEKYRIDSSLKISLV